MKFSNEMSDDRIAALEKRITALESGEPTKKKRKPKLPKDQRPPAKGRAKFMSEEMARIRKEWVASEKQVKDSMTGEMRLFKQPDVMREASAAWKKLSDEEKAKY